MTVSLNAHVKQLTNVGDPLMTQDGQPFANIKIKFQLVVFGSNKATSVIDAITGELVASTPTTVLTDSNGEFTTTLWPNNRGDTATAYYVTFSNKAFSPFFILIDEAIASSLLTAKAAYSAGTGAVNINELAVALNALMLDSSEVPNANFTNLELALSDSPYTQLPNLITSHYAEVTGYYAIFGKLIFYSYTVKLHVIANITTPAWYRTVATIELPLDFLVKINLSNNANMVITQPAMTAKLVFNEAVLAYASGMFEFISNATVITGYAMR